MRIAMDDLDTIIELNDRIALSLMHNCSCTTATSNQTCERECRE